MDTYTFMTGPLLMIEESLIIDGKPETRRIYEWQQGCDYYGKRMGQLLGAARVPGDSHAVGDMGVTKLKNGLFAVILAALNVDGELAFAVGHQGKTTLFLNGGGTVTKCNQVVTYNSAGQMQGIRLFGTQGKPVKPEVELSQMLSELEQL